MDKSEKNKISHRAKALDKLKEWLAAKKTDV
jgi:inosine triphosphate pyrophosphatase